MCQIRTMGFWKSLFVLVIICSEFVDIQAQRRRRPQMGQDGVFGEHPKQSRGQIHLKSFFNHRLSDAGNCEHNLCNNVTNYPTRDIQNMIMRKKEFHNFFGTVIQPYRKPTLTGKSPISRNYEEQNMCGTHQFTYYPQMALNKFRKRVVIVNVDKFRQAVTFETCVENAKCFLSEHNLIGYETACRQQYSLIRLVSVTEDLNISLDNIPIPSSCVCTYKRTADYND